MAGPTPTTGRATTTSRATTSRATTAASRTPRRRAAAAPATAPAAAPVVATVAAPTLTGNSVVIPAAVVATPATPAAPAAPATPRESVSVLYGLIVVLAGFVAILIGLWFVVINYKVASDATAVLGVITTAIAGLGGAFFGVAIGQQGTANANKERTAAEAGKDAAQMRAERYLAYLEPNVAKTLVK